MSKPQIILNAGGAAIAMAIAYRLTNRMIDSVLPKKKGEEEEPADEPKAHPALDLLELCVNGDADAARLLLDNGAMSTRPEGMVRRRCGSPAGPATSMRRDCY